MRIEKTRRRMLGFGPVINKKKGLKMHTFAVHPLHGSNGKTERAMLIRGRCDQIEGKMIEELC
jgi:hypothetical protein